MAFNAQDHFIQLPKRVKDKDTGKWIVIQEDYLEVKWRLVWFRDRFPHGKIISEEVCVDLDRVMTVEKTEWVNGKRETTTKTGTGYARYRTTVEDGEGGLATGYGTENAAEFADFVERAETRSVGRALAGLGIGTQFVGAEFGERLTLTETDGQGDTSGRDLDDKRRPRETVSPGPQVKPTKEEITQLMEWLKGVYRDAGQVDATVRGVLQIPEGQDMTPMRVRVEMTRAHYQQLHEDAEAYALAHQPADEDGPAAGMRVSPEGTVDTSTRAEGDGSDATASRLEDMSLTHEDVTTDDTPPDENVPEVEVNAKGLVMRQGMAKLRQRAAEAGTSEILDALERETPQMTRNRFGECWVLVGLTPGQV